MKLHLGSGSRYLEGYLHIDIADYEQFWIDKQGHANAPRLEDYQNNASYIENGITYTKDDYDPMEEYTKDYKLYWSH